VRCGHDTPGPQAGQGEVLGAFLRCGRDFVHINIDNPAKRIILNILKITGILPIREKGD
jgi:hypothetical protein